MQDFTVIQYANTQAEEFYGYWFKRIRLAFAIQEKESVLRGKRTQYIEHVNTNRFSEFKQFALTHNLYFHLLNTTTQSEIYTNTSTANGNILRLIVANSNIDYPTSDKEIGKLLGYPSEDIDFFDNIYVKRGILDPTWYQVPDEFKRSDTLKDIPYGSKQSTLLRWFGVRFAPHLPRNFYQCDSIKFAEKFENLLIELGFGKEQQMINMLLHGEIQYTSRNGIAVIETNAFRQITQSIGLEKGKTFIIKQHGEHIDIPDKRTWLMNGFSTYSAMFEQHTALLSVLEAVKQIDVCDLGAGNGILVAQQPGKKVQYEIDKDKIEFGKQLIKSVHIEFKHQDLINFGDEEVDTYIISINRFAERNELINKVEAILKNTSKRFVVYAYDTSNNHLFDKLIDRLRRYFRHEFTQQTEYITFRQIVLQNGGEN